MGESNIASLTHFLSILISYLASIHSNPIMQKLELGKLAFLVGITTAVGLCFSPAPAAEDHYFLSPLDWDVIRDNTSSPWKYSPNPTGNSHHVLPLSPSGIISRHPGFPPQSSSCPLPTFLSNPKLQLIRLWSWWMLKQQLNFYFWLCCNL